MPGTLDLGAFSISLAVKDLKLHLELRRPNHTAAAVSSPITAFSSVSVDGTSVSLAG